MVQQRPVVPAPLQAALDDAALDHAALDDAALDDAALDHPALDPPRRSAPTDVEEYIAARGPAMVRLARGLLKDPHHAEDVVQDVLAKVYLSWTRIQGADDPDAYVRRMVVNACTSFWRRAVRKERAYEPTWLPEGQVADRAGDHAETESMLALLRRLPTKQRAVLVLRHYEGLRDSEIADVLGCSDVTVRSNAHRGLASLRAMMPDHGGSVPGTG